MSTNLADEPTSPHFPRSMLAILLYVFYTQIVELTDGPRLIDSTSRCGVLWPCRRSVCSEVYNHAISRTSQRDIVLELLTTRTGSRKSCNLDLLYHSQLPIIMATTTETTPATVSTRAAVDLTKFPDGFKTSGQHPPVYSQVRPYSDFPKRIQGPTVWQAENYSQSPEKWTHRFTEEEIQEISDASDKFIQDKTPLEGISKVSLYFESPHLNHTSFSFL